MIKHLEGTWGNTRYGRAHKTTGKHYRLNVEKFSQLTGINIKEVEVSDILDIFEKDLEKSHEDAVIEAFSRHVTFVYDSIKVNSELYIKEIHKELSPWDVVKEMYYNFSDKYDCYSFRGKITLARLDSTSADANLWPIYADFDHSHIAESFMRLKYVEECSCEKDDGKAKPLSTCKTYCVNKHSNIKSKYLATKMLFENRSFKRMYTELYPTSPDIADKVLSNIPPVAERAIHVASLLKGTIIERVASEDFTEELNPGENLNEYFTIVNIIGVPSMTDLNSTHLKGIEKIELYLHEEEGE